MSVLWRISKTKLISEVKGFKGECYPTWLNRNQVFNRLDGGVTGFFKLTKVFLGIKWRVGKEFCGIIKHGKVWSTKEVPYD